MAYINRNGQTIQLAGDSHMVRLWKFHEGNEESSKCIGFCKGGARILDIASQIDEQDPEDRSYHPLVVLAGTNDILNYGPGFVDREELASNYMTLVDSCLEISNDVYLCTLPGIPRCGKSGKLYMAWRSLNKHIINAYEDYDNVEVIRIDKIFFDYPERKFIIDKFESDGIHMNHEGKDATVEEIWDCV